MTTQTKTSTPLRAPSRSRLGTIPHMIIGLSALAAVQPLAHAGDVSVTLTGVRAGGDVYVSLQTEDQFMSQSGVSGDVIYNTKGGTLRVSLGNVPAGTYAISVWHDVDADGVFDVDAAGMPTDGWAMVNGEMLRGAPTFEQVSFDVSDIAKPLRLRMAY